MKFKFPNYLTIGRIIIVPVFVFAFYLPGFYEDVIPFALFVIFLSIIFFIHEKSYIFFLQLFPQPLLQI